MGLLGGTHNTNLLLSSSLSQLTQDGEDADQNGDESMDANSHPQCSSLTLDVDPPGITATHLRQQQTNQPINQPIHQPIFFMNNYELYRPYFNGLKRKAKAPNTKTLVGGSMAMLP